MTRCPLNHHRTQADAGDREFSEHLAGQLMRLEFVQQFLLFDVHPGIACRHEDTQDASSCEQGYGKNLSRIRSAGRELRIPEVVPVSPPRRVKHREMGAHETARPATNAGPKDLHKVSVLQKNRPPAIPIQSTQAGGEW